MVVLSPISTASPRPHISNPVEWQRLLLGEDPAIFPNACTFHDGHITSNPGAFANLNILVNNSEGVDLYISCQSCVGMNIRMRMDHIWFNGNDTDSPSGWLYVSGSPILVFKLNKK
jgi:hypothetical protein